MGEEESFAFQYQRDILHWVGLNYRPSEHEPDALPTELQCMVTLTGVEPATSALWARHSTVELQRIASVLIYHRIPYFLPLRHYLLIVPNYTLKPAWLIRTEPDICHGLLLRVDTGLELNQVTINFRRKRIKSTTSFSGIWNGSHPIIFTILPRNPDYRGEWRGIKPQYNCPRQIISTIKFASPQL